MRRARRNQPQLTLADPALIFKVPRWFLRQGPTGGRYSGVSFMLGFLFLVSSSCVSQDCVFPLGFMTFVCLEEVV